jgi:hypothetical protein
VQLYHNRGSFRSILSVLFRSWAVKGKVPLSAVKCMEGRWVLWGVRGLCVGGEKGGQIDFCKEWAVIRKCGRVVNNVTGGN